MARDLSTIGNFVPYQGLLVSQPIALCTPIAKGDVPRSLVATINWADQGIVTAASVDRSVLINLQQGTKTPLDKIRGVYVDNSGSESPVYVMFPDTAQVITCPPGNTTFAPTFTNSLLAIVVVRGLLNTVTTVTTRVEFLNVGMNPYTSNENNEVKPLSLANNVAAAGPNFSPRFTYQVAGQLLIQKTISMSLAGISSVIFAAQLPTQPSWFWHITNMRVWVFGLQPAVNGQIILQLVNNGIVRGTFQAQTIDTNLDYTIGKEIYNQGPMDLILDGKFDTIWQNTSGLISQCFGTIELVYSGSPV